MGVAALAPSAARAQPPRSRNTLRLTGLLDQLSQQSQWRAPELRLARRITLGVTEADAARARSLGYEAYLEEQLHPERIDDSVCDERLKRPLFSRLLAYSAKELVDMHLNGTARADVFTPMQLLIAERAVHSRCQLQERMVEFFNDHLYVFHVQGYGLAPMHYERVIRPHVLGTFGAMTRAGMRSPAMLYYLDQNSSTRRGINENYARELLELHTIGVVGGFTQEDVHGLARILTGWGFNWHDGSFNYTANDHDFTAKSALGMSFPNRPQAYSGTVGMDEGIAFGEMLIAHERTKRYLATKLLQWFVRPNPTEAQIRAVMSAYGTDGDIKAMLRVVLSRDNITRAPAKLKRPFHFAMSAMRTTGAVVSPITDVRKDRFVNDLPYALLFLGHNYNSWSTPDGYPDRAEFWAGMIVDRWNVSEDWLLQTWRNVEGSIVADFSSFVDDRTVDGVVATINRRLFGGEISAALESELRILFRNGVTEQGVVSAMRLSVASPEFQFY